LASINFEDKHGGPDGMIPAKITAALLIVMTESLVRSPKFSVKKNKIGFWLKTWHY